MAPEFEKPQFAELLGVLALHGVEFVLVGGMAAVLAGAWQSTDDLDIVLATSSENHERTLRALADLDATYIDFAGRTIRPDLEKLRTFRLHLLRTRLGRLDLLREVGQGLTFERLVERSVEYEIGALTVRAIDLETLIQTKEIANRDKDRAHLLILRETQRLSRLKNDAP